MSRIAIGSGHAGYDLRRFSAFEGGLTVGLVRGAVQGLCDALQLPDALGFLIFATSPQPPQKRMPWVDESGRRRKRSDIG